MEFVNHKKFGVGEVVKREGNYLTVRFQNDGSEKHFVIPESFQLGLLKADGELKKEVDKAILEKTPKPRIELTFEQTKTKEATKSTPVYHYCFLSVEDIEIVDLLNELCPDFTTYNFLKCDLYKGSLLGGTNVYFKKGRENKCGMVATKTAVEHYSLYRYPYNFKTEGVGKGNDEQGWSGEILLSMLKDLKKKYLY